MPQNYYLSSSSISSDLSGGADFSKSLVTLTAQSGIFQRIIYVNDLYVAVGSGTGSNIRTSLDLVTWVSQSVGTSTYNGVAWGNGLFVAVGGSLGTPVLRTSTTGTSSWTTRTSNAGNVLDGITWGNGLFVAVGNGGVITTSADGITWTARTSGTTSELNSVAWGAGVFVAVGASGVIRTSPDGITWTAQTSGTTNTLITVARINNQFVAVGASGTVLTSTDGITWTTRTSGITDSLYSVQYGNSVYVAVGLTGSIITSSDAITWTTRSSGTTNNIYDVVWDGQQFVAVGDSGLILTSATGTSGWQYHNSDTLTISLGSAANRISYGFTQPGVPGIGGVSTGTFVVDVYVTTANTNVSIAVALARVNSSGAQQAVTSYTASQTATFGLKVFTITDPALGTWQSGDRLRVQYQFVNSAMNTQTFAIQTGTTNTEIITPFYAVQPTLYWVGGSGTWSNTGPANWAGTSGGAGGLSWPTSETDVVFDSASDTGSSFTVTLNRSPVCKSLTVSAPDQTMTLAGTSNLPVAGNLTLSSTNFSSTTTGTLSMISSGLNAAAQDKIIWTGTQYVVVGDSGFIATSSNGTSWTLQNSGVTVNLQDIVWTGTQYVVVGSSGTILTSSNSINWTLQTSGTTQTLYGITWSGSLFVAVGNNDTIITSSNSTTWTSRDSGTVTADFYSVAWSGSRFVALGVNSDFTSSTDGITWSEVTGITGSENLFQIRWLNNQFIVVGQQERIATSPDGITWTTRRSSGSNELYDIAWSGSQYVATGIAGTVLTSTDSITWTVQTTELSAALNGVIWSGSEFIAVGASGFIATSSNGTIWTPTARATKTITTNGLSVNFPVTINTISEKVQLGSSLTLGSEKTLTLTAGALDLNGFDLTTDRFSSNNANTRSIAFGTNKIVVTGNSATVWDCVNTLKSYYSGIARVEFTYSGSTGTRTIRNAAAAGMQVNNITPSVFITAGSDSLSFTNAGIGSIVDTLDFTGFSGTVIGTSLVVNGNLVISPTMTLSAGTGVLTFNGTSGTQDITTAGKTFDFPVTMSGFATRRLQDALTLGSTRTLTLTSGTFDANNKNVTLGAFSSSNTNTRTLTMGSGTWTLQSPGGASTTTTIWSTGTTTNLTFNKDTANIVYSASPTYGVVFSGGGLTYNKLTVSGGSSNFRFLITGNNTFSELASTTTTPWTLAFGNTSTVESTTTVGNWTISGTASNLVNLRSGYSSASTVITTTAYSSNIVKTGGGTITVSYLDIQASDASPSNTWLAPTTSGNVDSGFNTGWNFTTVSGQLGNFLSLF